MKSADIVGGLTGTVTIDTSGTGYITVTAVADNVTDGDENMTITIGGKTSATVVRVLDTSKTPVVVPGSAAPIALTTGIDAVVGAAAGGSTFNAVDVSGVTTWRMLQFVDSEFTRLQGQSAVFQTARIAYAKALGEALPKFEGDTIKLP